MQIRAEQIRMLKTGADRRQAEGPNSGALIAHQNSIPSGLKLDERQGIA
jgi:hypothetical protein